MVSFFFASWLAPTTSFILVSVFCATDFPLVIWWSLVIHSYLRALSRLEVLGLLTMRFTEGKKKRDSPKDDLARKICRIYRYHFGLLRFSREIFSNFLLQRYSPSSLQPELIQKKHWGGVCVGCCQYAVYILWTLLRTEVLSTGLSIP